MILPKRDNTQEDIWLNECGLRFQNQYFDNFEFFEGAFTARHSIFIGVLRWWEVT